MDHLSRNWKRYAVGAALVIVAGLAKLGYLPQAVADWLTGLFGAF